ncbi:YibE/F family protein [Brevibacterium litoralis]|uniref:YibE/F family protein n=1 Tax=Brevibacterium litoralis TaxID=3138935 RepID=UPI0032F08A74
MTGGSTSAGVRVTQRVWTLLLSVLVPCIALALIGLLVLWPGLGPQSPDGSAGAGDPVAEAPSWDPAATTAGAGFVTGRVTSLDLRECPEAERAGCEAVTVEVTGVDEPSEPVEVGDTGDLVVPPEAIRAGLAPGDQVRAQPMAGSSGDFVFVDFDRTVPLWVLAALYALVVVLVAGLRGLRAIVGLVLAFGVVLVFLVPSLLAGEDAVSVGIVASAVIMLVVLYLAHGFSARTTVALLGTFGGIAIAGVLAGVFSLWARLAGIHTEESYLLLGYGITPADLVVCGILVAGLGALNDVTITQASAVWELAGSDRRMSARTLFARAMRIGRDHIASTVYTIAFAFAGGALASLVLVGASSRGFLQSLTLGQMSFEVVSILVTSTGLVLAVPLTTALAVWAATSGTQERDSNRDRANG